MAPLDNSSGRRKGTRHAKQVNIRARTAMMTAMNRHILRVGESEQYYRKKRNEGKKHNQAIRSLGRHMVRVLWSMIRNGHFYENREVNNIMEVVKEAIPA
jgi:transposase